MQTGEEEYQNQCFQVPQRKHDDKLKHIKSNSGYKNCLPIWHLVFLWSYPVVQWDILMLIHCHAILTRVSVLKSRKKYGRFCWDSTVSVQQRSQTCWSVFRVTKALSFIYSIALPWSSMSHFHCWCWCHFSNASMGTGICMTPPPPPLTTNSSFNTSAKCPVRHTLLELAPFSLFMLNNESFTLTLMCLTRKSVKEILVGISLIGYVSCRWTAVKTYTLWNGNDCQA